MTKEVNEANRSYNYNRALDTTLTKDLEDHPRDPIYFNYKGKAVRIVPWITGSRLKKWSDGNTALDVEDLRGQKVELKNTKVFELIPLGRIRQHEGTDGLMTDCFEPVPEVERLYERLQRMIKRNQARWDEEDRNATDD